MAMSFEEIKELLDGEINKNEFEELQGDYPALWGTVKQVRQEGGEGEGENYVVVNHFVDHDVYVRLRGFYSSYDGVDFNGYGYEQVEPVQKTITVYK